LEPKAHAQFGGRVSNDPKSRRRLVLVTSGRWHDTSRLALAAREAGFEVHLLGPKQHPVGSLDWVHVADGYSTLWPIPTVARTLNRTAFDVVVPVDDPAAALLFESHASGRLNEWAAALLHRSLGDSESFGIRHDRAAVAEIAADEQLRGPRTWRVPNEAALPDLVDWTGLPVVLKSDGSSAGEEVIVANDLEAARAAYRELLRLPRLKSSLGSSVFERDAYSLRRRLLASRRTVSIQEFVAGEPATLSAVAWEGKVLGEIGLRVIHTRCPNGPATVVEPLQHPDMSRAGEALARRLGLSGFFGLDFILSPDGSTVSLIELNPRVTPTAYMHTPSLPRPLFHLLGDRVGLDTAVCRAPQTAERIAVFSHAVDAQADGAVDAHLDIPDAEDVVALCRSANAGPVVQTLRSIF
jgi:hypothetical protein